MRIMFPESSDAETRRVIKDQLFYQLMLSLCLKTMSCIFYCSHPVPTRLGVFNKQAGQVRRSCCLISLCSTHWGHEVPWYFLPGGTCGWGMTRLPPPPQQRQTKSMQTSFLLNIASAGWASHEQCRFSGDHVLPPAVADSRCFSSECRKLHKTAIILPWWPHKIQWYKPKAAQFPSRQMQAINNWMCSSVFPHFNFFF